MNLKTFFHSYRRRLAQTFQIWLDKFKNTIHFTRRERKQNLYVIISPQDKGKTSSFSISYLLIALVLLIFVASALGGFYFHRTQTDNHALLATRQQQQAEYQKKLTTLTETTEAINEFQTVRQQQINDIFEFLGNYHKEQLWKASPTSNLPSPTPFIDSFETLFTDDNYATATEILNQLKENEIFLEHGYSYLTNIENYLVLRQVVSKTLPNGWPLEKNNGYKTSSFGPRFSPFEDKMEFHPGVDLAAAPNSQILSAAEGIVEFSGEKTGYGQIAIIRHQYGYKTLYAHNKSILVEQGDIVKKGQPIAILGNTGRSTGHHLHFEVRIGNKPVDPWPYIVKNF